MSEQAQVSMALFWKEASQVLERVIDTQSGFIRQAAQVCADCIEGDGIIHTFGTGHSRAFAMELVHRAGGLACFSKMDLEDLALMSNWSLAEVKSPEIERSLEAGQELLSCYKVGPADIFLVVSQSGGNKAVVECATQIKERGHPLLVVTAMEHTNRVTPRHPSGKRLYELADIVIDSCGPYGDTLLDIPGGGKTCSVSSLSGALIAQMLTAEIVKTLLERGQTPPIYVSDNIPDGVARNQGLFDRYKDRVRI